MENKFETPIGSMTPEEITQYLDSVRKAYANKPEALARELEKEQVKLYNSIRNNPVYGASADKPATVVKFPRIKIAKDPIGYWHYMARYKFHDVSNPGNPVSRFVLSKPWKADNSKEHFRNFIHELVDNMLKDNYHPTV